MFGINRRYFNDFDWPLLGLIVGVAAFGILEISSAQPSPGLWERQLKGLGIGLVVLFVTTLVDYRRIINIAPYLYGVGVVLLILVLTPLGEVVNGNKAWLNLGFVRFQPSEVAKLFTLLFLTAYLAGVRKRPLDLWTMIIVGVIWVVPTALVFAQNDTGSALSFSSFLVATLFLAGIRWRWLAAGIIAVVLTVGFSVPYIKQCKSYKCERIKAVYW